MLLCETCGGETRDLEDLAVFVAQLAALRVGARIHVGSVPQNLGRNLRFDLAPYLVDGAATERDRLLLLAAPRLTDEKLLSLRQRAKPLMPCFAVGSFATRQARLGTLAKIAYVIGREPEHLEETPTPLEDPEQPSGYPIFGVERRSAPPERPRALLVAPELGDPGAQVLAISLSLSRRFDLAILTDGRSKTAWQASRGIDLPIFHYGEILPPDLAERVDICACFTEAPGNYRLQSLLANLARSGAALIDCTTHHSLSATAGSFVRGPRDLSILASFLSDEIVPNRAQIADRVAASRLAAQCDPARLLDRLGVGPRERAQAGPARRITFIPTNGIGLGHAQRCVQIARDMPATPAPAFAAFPSCLRLIKTAGFDVMPLVSRSAAHAESFENDLANYLRLRAMTDGTGTLVFDGGYIFDSIYRTILENRLSAVWIRRGLWQATQNNAVALDREKAFSRVIVPREAFDELNAAYSRGRHVAEVGPIVARPGGDLDSRGALRRALADRYGLEFQHLCVTCLGGGVAADRSAQIQALCALMERRADTLHLVLVWPGGRQEPAWFGWTKTRVVRTLQAGTLIAAADLCVAAAGYNLFHEVLYTRVPAIFMPQTGPFMDDQRARARAAASRNLALALEPRELARLEREIARILDTGFGCELTNRLAQTDLPEPGNAHAAALISEVADAGT